MNRATNTHEVASSLVGEQNGIALLMVIWIVTIMIVIVMAFSMTARTNAFSTLAFRESVKRDFVFEAGVQQAIMELFYSMKKPEDDETIWRADGTVYKEKLGDTEYAVRVIDEGGKIDINKADEIILKGLLSSLEVKEDDIDIITDSILDWRDPDDLVRLHGAENDYYMSLPRPYKPKNADFDSLEELLLVRGITSELLYGAEGKKRGLIEFLTVYSKDTRININTASKEVLMSIPGMSAEQIDVIMSNRQKDNLRSQQPVPGNLSGPYMKSSNRSNLFTIEVSVIVGENPAAYGTRAVVRLEGNNKYSILYWKNMASLTSQ